jgi:UDP-glucuronate 4-epimerase
MTDTYLITGGMGCIGAWALRHLIQSGKQVVNFDQSADTHRLDWLMSAEEQENITFVQGDLRDTDAVKAVVKDHDITHVIHLAALQVPMCRANPVLGAQVNIVGTVNIFEAARASDIQHITYASSIAVYGPPDDYPPGLIAHDAPKTPRTLYGAYKVANENTAQVYFNDYGISSTTLRPYTVYGVGRDQGMTSEPTKALLAAAKGEPYTINFGGKMQFHFASDVAQQFILASEQSLGGAYGFNMGQQPQAVTEFVDIIKNIVPSATIEVDDKPLPFPIGFDDAELRKHFDTIYEMSLADGIQQTLDHIKQLGDKI